MKEDQERTPLKTILQNFLNHVENLEICRSEEDSYEKEFQDLKLFTENLKSLKEYACTEGEKEVNRKKNRYKDILPFDHTRVVLSEYCGIPGSDYINANYIKGASGSKAYIASQGPLPNTVNDFWRMVVECDVQVIIMACNEKESGKHKCENYWVEKEGEEKQFGMVTIKLIKASKVCPDFLVRTMQLKYTLSQTVQERTVCQFHYSAWPDHGVPPLVRPLLDMVRLVRDTQASETLPVLIHCSAGCGRTGTICAIDYVWGLLRAGKLTKDFSLYNLVRDMRKQRIAMVQTKDQYILVHQAVHELFQEQLRMIDAHPYENIDMNGMPLMKEEPLYEMICVENKVDEKQDSKEKEGSSNPLKEGMQSATKQENNFDSTSKSESHVEDTSGKAPPLPHKKRKGHIPPSKQEKEVENLTQKQRSIEKSVCEANTSQAATRPITNIQNDLIHASEITTAVAAVEKKTLHMLEKNIKPMAESSQASEMKAKQTSFGAATQQALFGSIEHTNSSDNSLEVFDTKTNASSDTLYQVSEHKSEVHSSYYSPPPANVSHKPRIAKLKALFERNQIAKENKSSGSQNNQGSLPTKIRSSQQVTRSHSLGAVRKPPKFNQFPFDDKVKVLPLTASQPHLMQKSCTLASVHKHRSTTDLRINQSNDSSKGNTNESNYVEIKHKNISNQDVSHTSRLTSSIADVAEEKKPAGGVPYKAEGVPYKAHTSHSRLLENKSLSFRTSSQNKPVEKGTINKDIRPALPVKRSKSLKVSSSSDYNKLSLSSNFPVANPNSKPFATVIDSASLASSASKKREQVFSDYGCVNDLQVQMLKKNTETSGCRKDELLLEKKPFVPPKKSVREKDYHGKSKGPNDSSVIGEMSPCTDVEVRRLPTYEYIVKTEGNVGCGNDISNLKTSHPQEEKGSSKAGKICTSITTKPIIAHVNAPVTPLCLEKHDSKVWLNTSPSSDQSSSLDRKDQGGNKKGKPMCGTSFEHPNEPRRTRSLESTVEDIPAQTGNKSPDYVNIRELAQSLKYLKSGDSPHTHVVPVTQETRKIIQPHPRKPTSTVCVTASESRKDINQQFTCQNIGSPKIQGSKEYFVNMPSVEHKANVEKEASHKKLHNESGNSNQVQSQFLQNLAKEAQRKINTFAGGLGIRERRNSFRQAISKEKESKAGAASTSQVQIMNRIKDYEPIWLQNECVNPGDVKRMQLQHIQANPMCAVAGNSNQAAIVDVKYRKGHGLGTMLPEQVIESVGDNFMNKVKSIDVGHVSENPKAIFRSGGNVGGMNSMLNDNSLELGTHAKKQGNNNTSIVQCQKHNPRDLQTRTTSASSHLTNLKAKELEDADVSSGCFPFSGLKQATAKSVKENEVVIESIQKEKLKLKESSSGEQCDNTTEGNFTFHGARRKETDSRMLEAKLSVAGNGKSEQVNSSLLTSASSRCPADRASEMDKRGLESGQQDGKEDLLSYGLVARVQLRRGSRDDLDLRPAAPPRVKRHASVVVLRHSLIETNSDGIQVAPLSVWKDQGNTEQRTSTASPSTSNQQGVQTWQGAPGVDVDTVAANMKSQLIGQVDENTNIITRDVQDVLSQPTNQTPLTRALEVIHSTAANIRTKFSQKNDVKEVHGSRPNAAVLSPSVQSSEVPSDIGTKQYGFPNRPSKKPAGPRDMPQHFKKQQQYL